MLEMLTIAPPPRRRIAGMACLEQWTTEPRLIPITWFQSSIEESAKVFMLPGRTSLYE